MAFVISHKYKFVYVHIPKTGGTSLCHTKGLNRGYLDNKLGSSDISLGHQHVSYAGDCDYKKWCSIREPLDRAVSMYYDHIPYYGWKSFDEFCEFTWNTNIMQKSHILWPQSWYITDKLSGELLVDDFIVFENMKEDIERFLREHNIPVEEDYPHLQNRKKRSRDLGDYYRGDNEELIREVYAKDFELYEKAGTKPG